MTVIAYRDGTLAADTLITSNLDRAGQCIKIKRVDPWLIGYAGNLGSLQALINWINDTKSDFTKPVEYPTGMESCGMLVDASGQGYYVSDESRYVTPITAPYLAIGCGASIARTAMYLGFGAIEAVEAAIDLDVACGGKVTYITIDGEEDLTLSE